MVASHPKASSLTSVEYSTVSQGRGQILHQGVSKYTILPCGYSIAASWAALRKSWLGFKIANANGETEEMEEYAANIRKVQLELGISTTKFDPWILEDQESESDEYTELNKEENILEDSVEYDYDEIMHQARAELERVSCDIPRKQLFDHSPELEGPGTLEESYANLKSFSIDDESSEGRTLECETLERPDRQDCSKQENLTGVNNIEGLGPEGEDDPRWEERARKSCVYRPNQEGHSWEERARRSCVFTPRKIAAGNRTTDVDEQSDTSETEYSHLDSDQVNNNESENEYRPDDSAAEVYNFEEDESADRKSCKYVRK